jgi:hypothetical protein
MERAFYLEAFVRTRIFAVNVSNQAWTHAGKKHPIKVLTVSNTPVNQQHGSSSNLGTSAGISEPHPV